MKKSLIPWCEFNQLSFRGPRTILNHTGTLDDAPGFGAIEVSGGATVARPKFATNGPAFAPDKFVDFKAAGRCRHLFHPGNINLGGPPLAKLGARRSGRPHVRI